MNNRQWFGFFLLCGFGLLAVGCGGSGDSTTKNAEPWVTVRDSLGRDVSLWKRPVRIVSLSARNTELLFAIGAGSQVVGVTNYCNYPPEAGSCETVGNTGEKNLNLEKILALQPDFVVAYGTVHHDVADRLARMKIPTVCLEAKTFDELYAEIEYLGKATGHVRNAERLIASIKPRIAAVVKIAKTIPADERVTVYYQVWDQPLQAAGPASFIGRLIEMCGGVNVVVDRNADYPRLSEETILVRNPDVILVPDSYTEEEMRKKFREKRGWQNVRAVKTGRIYALDRDLISRFGPRVGDALEMVLKALYPQRVQDELLLKKEKEKERTTESQRDTEKTSD